MPEENVSGTPGSTQSPSGSGSNSTSQSSTSASGGDTSRAAGQGDGQTKQYTYPEDRSQFIDPSKLKGRFDEVSRKAAADAEARLTERFKAELEARDRKIQALAGVSPTDPRQAEAEQIREALYELVPELKQLKGLPLDKIMERLESMDGAVATSEHVWEKHAMDMLSNVESEVAKAMGGDLTDRQRKAIARAYRDEAEAAMQAREHGTGDPSNDFLARHQRGDQSLIKEFADAWVKDWFEPARRSVMARTVERHRAVPRSGPGQAVTSGKPQVDNKDPDAVMERAVEYLKEKGAF